MSTQLPRKPNRVASPLPGPAPTPSPIDSLLLRTTLVWRADSCVHGSSLAAVRGDGRAKPLRQRICMSVQRNLLAKIGFGVATVGASLALGGYLWWTTAIHNVFSLILTNLCFYTSFIVGVIGLIISLTACYFRPRALAILGVCSGSIAIVVAGACAWVIANFPHLVN